MGWRWHISGDVVVPITDIKFPPCRTVQPSPMVGKTSRINLDHFDDPAKNKNLVIIWCSAGAVVDELFNDDARLNVLIGPHPRFFVIALIQPTGTGFY